MQKMGGKWQILAKNFTKERVEYPFSRSVHTELLAIALAMPKNGNWILSMVPFTLALVKSLMIAIPVEKTDFY